MEIKIIEDNAKVINFESLLDLIMTNFEITDSYTEQLITIVTFQSWDGDLSGKDVTDALKELGIKNPKNSVGMTIIFDIEQGNYGIKIGGRLRRTDRHQTDGNHVFSLLQIGHSRRGGRGQALQRE